MKKWYSIGLLVIAMVLASAFVVACGNDEEAAVDEALEALDDAMADLDDAMTDDSMADDAAADDAMTDDAADDSEADAAGGIPAEVDTNTLGIYVIAMGDNVLAIWDVPAPGMAFPVHDAAESDDDFAMVIEVWDADGNSLGTLSTLAGNVDYSEFAADAAKITVTNKAGEEIASYDIGM